MKKGDWVFWLRGPGSQFAHRIHMKPKGHFDIPDQDDPRNGNPEIQGQEWEGISSCGEIIPGRGVYDASPMMEKCVVCLKKERKENKW